ncbi:MAG: hypothetical protein MK209_01765 [Planctomycetes bacterium]|nr:hypothetical protein [Planctomycetota bacterium]
MSTDTPPRQSKRDQLERARRRQPFQGKDRLRLAFMALGLFAAIGIFLWLRAGLDKKGDPDKVPEIGTEFQIGSDIQFPPVDISMFDSVRDDTTTQRLILEPNAFPQLLKVASALLPGHLDALGSPHFPFDNIERNAKTLRGAPFRERGEILDLKTETRTINGPEETWVLAKTDEGDRLWYVTLKQPEELFGIGGNFVVLDGFFYKLYTRSVEGERVTAPLLVGRGVRPSVRPAEPAQELDLTILADVQDVDFYQDRPIEDFGFWHLMNYVETLQNDEERLTVEFERAQPFDSNELKTIIETPSLKRGIPYRIYGRTVHAWNRANDENPTRLPFSSHCFLFKYELGDQYLRLVAPGKDALNNLGLGTEMLAYFHKFWAYTDGDDQPRRVPVFFVASFRERELKRSPLEGQIVLGFIGLFVVMLVGFGWLVLRDRKQAEVAAANLRARRQRMREKAPRS